MNFATLRLCGRVESVARESRFDNGPYLAFRLSDATGALRVAVDSAAVADLIRRNAVPRPGARLDVGGTLQYKCGQRPLLRVHSAQQVQVVEESPRPIVRSPGGAHG